MPEDAGVLAEAILKLKQNEGRRLEMGRRARAVAEAEFDRPEAYKKIERLIAKLVDGE